MSQIDAIDKLHLYYACMKLHQVRALVAIAETGSFMAAAEHLRISQSSLSHAIADLEEELNLRLLERGREGTVPTEAGRRVLIHARQISACLDSIRAEAANMAGLLSGKVRIGSVPSAAVAFLPRLIAQVVHEHPQVEVLLLEEPSQGMQQLIEWLKNNVIDVALLELPVNGLHVVSLMSDELCAIVSKSSPLARRAKISIRELAEKPFIMSRYNSERLIWNAYAAHKCSPQVRFEVQDIGTLVSMVREGLGVSIVPRVAFPLIPDGVILRPVNPCLRRELAFVMKSPDRLGPALGMFIRKAHELVELSRAARVHRRSR
jgi:DNA-binding transcriptional LysR family regulator